MCRNSGSIPQKYSMQGEGGEPDSAIGNDPSGKLQSNATYDVYEGHDSAKLESNSPLNNVKP